MLNGTTTRSPGRRLVTSRPTSSTMPIGSWPRMSPSARNGPNNSYRWRSEPQIAVDVTRITASVAASIDGSGTSSTRTSRRPCHVSAFMGDPFDESSSAIARPYPLPRRGKHAPRRRASLLDLAGLLVHGVRDAAALAVRGAVHDLPRAAVPPEELVHLRLCSCAVGDRRSVVGPVRRALVRAAEHDALAG